jgi:hypothetical protein
VAPIDQGKPVPLIWWLAFFGAFAWGIIFAAATVVTIFLYWLTWWAKADK